MRGWLIAPVCSVPIALAAAGEDPWPDAMYVTYERSEKVVRTVSRDSPSGMTQFTFQSNGYNGLPNPRSLAAATTGDPAQASFNIYNEANTEWFGVMLINAIHNGDAILNTATGGNHGSSGGAGGGKTARNLTFTVTVIGQKLETDYIGYADRIQIYVVNELMASNTISSGRYALKQEYWIDIVENTVAVHAKYTALEDLVVKRDRALQLNTQGYRGTVLFAGGHNSNRSNWDATKSNSGAKSLAPHAWAAILKGEYGQIAVWMDRSFGAASDLSSVSDDKALIHTLGRKTTQKLYNAIVFHREKFLRAGESYEWRGGYAWSRSNDDQPGTDSVLKRLVGAAVIETIIYPDGHSDNVN